MSGHSRFCTTVFTLAILAVSGRAQSTVSHHEVIAPDTTIHRAGVTIIAFNHPHMMIVGVPDTLVFLYLPLNNAPLDSVARKEGLRCLINGSFFNGERGNASHAGWLSLYGRKETPMMDDRQLTHVVRIKGSRKEIEFIPVRSYHPSTDAGLVEFQTGPLVIDSGVVCEDLIRNSINGPTQHTRTLLATLNRAQLFFITVTDYVTLSELGSMLNRLSVFQKGRLDVVNLDGGSSVALYLRDVPGFDVNAEDRLPILIGFH